MHGKRGHELGGEQVRPRVDLVDRYADLHVLDRARLDHREQPLGVSTWTCADWNATLRRASSNDCADLVGYGNSTCGLGCRGILRRFRRLTALEQVRRNPRVSPRASSAAGAGSTFAYHAPLLPASANALGFQSYLDLFILIT